MCTSSALLALPGPPGSTCSSSVRRVTMRPARIISSRSNSYSLTVSSTGWPSTLTRRVGMCSCRPRSDSSSPSKP